MKKRKGFLLLEALTALLLLSALAISVFPLAGRMAGASFLGSLRAEMGETGLFAMDFMTEKIRNSMKPSASPVSGDRFTYYAKNACGDPAPYELMLNNACGDPAPYELMLNQEKIKVELYNGLVQPVTGEKSGSGERIPLSAGEEGLFRRQPGGPVHISFLLSQKKGSESLAYETSIMPYADFYRKGQAYE